jgi:hypothetical protein
VAATVVDVQRRAVAVIVAAMVVDDPLPAVAAMAVHVPLPAAAVMVEVATAVDALRAVAAMAVHVPLPAAAVMVAEGVPPLAVQLRATTVEDSRTMAPIVEGKH